MKRKLYALIFAAGFADRFRSANCGFFAAGDEAVLIDLPRGIETTEFAKDVERLTGRPPRRLVLTAVAQSKTAHDAIRANFQQLKTATQAELAKSDPDLAALASLSDQLQQQNIAQRKQARAAWLALYGTFSADQKTTVKDAINARMARMDAFRQRMQDRLSGG